MNTCWRAALTTCMVCLGWLAGGCGQGPFNVEVVLDDKDPGLTDKLGALQSIEVNFVGVNETERPRWEQMSMSEYWQPGNPIRASAKKHVMTFGQGREKQQVLKKSNPMWRVWLGERQAKHLFVLAYLPWIRKDQPGDADPRRTTLPLEIGRWEWYLWGADTIRIQLGSGGISCLREPKEK